MATPSGVLVKKKDGRWGILVNGAWHDEQAPVVSSSGVQGAVRSSGTSSPELLQAVVPVKSSAPHVDRFVEAVKKQNAPSSAPAPLRPITPTSQSLPPTRPQQPMADVRIRPAAVGPIDELALFTLSDFRRLHPTPAAAADRLEQKIRMLEDESYEKFAAAVAALKASPLYLNYLAIIERGLEKKEPLERVLANVGTLRRDEFDALLSLSKRIAM